MRRAWLLLLLILGASAPSLADEATIPIAVCAPGFPSNTAAAQPTMDALAAALERTAGWPAGRLRAVYHPVLADGLALLDKKEEAALAIVPFPFWVEFHDRFDLVPLLEAREAGGASEVWTLVARRGAVGSPEALAGWAIESVAGYSPGFVGDRALAGFGPLPADARIVFTASPLSALRRAAAGERVAVLLDGGQAWALAQLPFGSELGEVHRSPGLPGTLLCRVGDRVSNETAAVLEKAFLGLCEVEGGAGLLSTMRLEGFARIDPAHRALLAKP